MIASTHMSKESPCNLPVRSIRRIYDFGNYVYNANRILQSTWSDRLARKKQLLRQLIIFTDSCLAQKSPQEDPLLCWKFKRARNASSLSRARLSLYNEHQKKKKKKRKREKKNRTTLERYLPTDEKAEPSDLRHRIPHRVSGGWKPPPAADLVNNTDRKWPDRPRVNGLITHQFYEREGRRGSRILGRHALRPMAQVWSTA